MEEKPEAGRHGGSEPPRHPAPVIQHTEEKAGPLPVWFFVGIIFAIYGVIIFITGLTEISHPPPTALSYIHPAIWWGAVIWAVGGFFIYRFGPWSVRH